MIFVKCSCLACSIWMIISQLPAVKTKCTVSDAAQTHTVPQRMSATMSCPYTNTNNMVHFRVFLNRSRTLCSYVYMSTTWVKQSCADNIRFIWIAETREIAFELLNLQINDSGFYTCIVEQHAPPPTMCLGVMKNVIYVIAHPLVSVSCVKGADGSSPKLLLCTSEGFYPAALQQAWIRTGENITYINTSHANRQYLNTSDMHWNYSIKADGSYTLTSYLQLSAPTSEHAVYCCWVNHSSLSQPVTVNISSAACYEDVWWRNVFIVSGISCAVVTGLILAVCCHHFRRSCPPSPGRVPRPTEPASRSQVQFQVYSTLGNHQPVPCQPSRNHARTPTNSQR